MTLRDDAGGTPATLGPLPTDPPWLTRAWQDLGQRETPGAGNAAWLMALPSRFARWVREFYTADHIPWCALWASACLVDVGIPAPANPLGARAYVAWGDPVTGAIPRGAVVVLSRTGGGHVGFALAETPGTVTLLSGNSRDQVSVDVFDKMRVLAVRYPRAYERTPAV